VCIAQLTVPFVTVMSSSSGWLTAKKRGRDDEQIERDRLAALERRKRKRPGNAAVTTAGAKKGKDAVNKKRPKQNKQRRRPSNESLDSLAEFVVDSSEEEEFVESASSSEEEIAMDKPNNRSKLKVSYDSDDTDDDVSEVHEVQRLKGVLKPEPRDKSLATLPSSSEDESDLFASAPSSS
jgi:hypothetical protein